MGLYDDIQVPITGQPASASLFGQKVRNYIIDIDTRLAIVEQLTAQLPAPVKLFGNGNNIIVTGTNVWGNLPTTTWTTTMTNPSSVFDMWCDVKFGAWMSSTAGSVRMSMNLSGGMTTTELPNAVTIVGYGLMPLETSADGLSRQHEGGFSLKIPKLTSTVTFTPRGLRDTTSGVQHLDYPTIEITPLRFSV